MTETTSNATPEISEARAILAEYLAQCRSAITGCFQAADDGQKLTPIEALQYRLGAARLIKTSLALAEALEGPRSQFTQRIVVERSSAETPHPVPSQGEGGGG